MPFVKLDTKILDSTLWIDRECRDIFITALLMAEPREITEPKEAIKIDSLDPLGFTVPPGWYGFVPAAGAGIVRRAQIPGAKGMIALGRLANPELESRCSDHEGRRMVRVDGGYLILNFMKYRDHDYNAAERMRRLRAHRKAHRNSGTNAVGHADSVRPNKRNVPPVHPNVTDADADADADADLKSKSKAKERFAPPSLTELTTYIRDRKSPVDPQAFCDFYESKGWKVGSQPMKDWRASVRTWEQRETRDRRKCAGVAPGVNGVDLKRQAVERLQK